MERHAMRVAGIGFRGAAPLASLRAALEAAGGPAGLAALATVATKAEAPELRALARDLDLPIRAIPGPDLAAQVTLTRSPRVEALHGTGSLAEAAALAAAGPGARLLGPRATAPDGMATAAIAERPGGAPATKIHP
jgi:cobalt-precorrin 5A hydrolase